MLPRTVGNHWHKTFWKIVTNPTFGVLAAIAVVVVATLIVVETDMALRHTPPNPLLFGNK
jgi:hypothetical protein